MSDEVRRPHAPPDAVRRAQDYYAPRVGEYGASASHADARELARMVAAVGARPGLLALDVATGGGNAARALVSAGCRVVALDATRGMLQALRAARAGMPEAPAIEGACADALALPFRDGCVDVVVSRIAPHHFADLGLFCREAARVLRRGGSLHAFDLTTPEGAAEAAVIDRVERLRDPSHGHSWSLAEWRAALEVAGLAVERLEAASSEFDLEPWFARARMPPEREAEVRRLFAEHPPSALGGYGVVAPGRIRVLRVEALARKG